MITVQQAGNKNFGIINGASIVALFRLNGALPSKHYMKGGMMYIQLTGANIDALEAELGDINWQCLAAKQYLLTRETTEINRGLKIELIADPHMGPHINYEFKLPPFDHQLVAFKLSKDLPFFGYFMEMGCGKTKVGIDNIAYLYERDLLDTVLIIAPNGVHVQWIVEQLVDHMPDRIEHEAAYYRSNLRAAEKKTLAKALAFDGLRIIAINIEALSHKSGIEWAKAYLATSGKRMCCLDESSKIKKPGAKRTRSVQTLGKMCEYRRIMTGSPVTSGVENLFSQLKFLSDEILGLTSYVSFKARYCIMETFDNYQKIVGYKMIDELQAKMDPWTYRVKKSDCLDLPEKTYIERRIELTKEQKHYYDEMFHELMVQLETGEIVDATLAIVKLLRLQQIICGHLPSEEGGMAWQLPHDKNPRISAVLELIEESQGQVIVWARFKHDLASLEQALGDKYTCVSYHGATKTADREEAKRAFVSGDARIFIANPAAAGIGLNLNVASEVIYYSNSFDAEQRWQSEDRAHRIGMKCPVTYYDLVVPGTVDRKILSTLKKKKNLADMTIDGLKEFLSEKDE